jgi:hypothetical protein
MLAGIGVLFMSTYPDMQRLIGFFLAMIIAGVFKPAFINHFAGICKAGTLFKISLKTFTAAIVTTAYF